MNSIQWLEPVSVNFEKSNIDEKKLLKLLRSQIKKDVERQKHDLKELSRCVYVIRMTGAFIVSYKSGNSPVLYIGRGEVGQRLAAHLKNWLSEVKDFGKEVGVEIRICLPRRRKREEFFKNVEADLIVLFYKKFKTLPFFNRRRETAFEGKVKYNKTTIKIMHRSLGIGSGYRPLWAIKPTPANPNQDTYLAGQ